MHAENRKEGRVKLCQSTLHAHTTSPPSATPPSTSPSLGLSCTIVVLRILALVLVPLRTVRAAHRHRVVWRPHRIMVRIAGPVTLEGGRGGGHVEVRQWRLVRSVAEQPLLFVVPPRRRTVEVVIPGVPQGSCAGRGAGEKRKLARPLSTMADRGVSRGDKRSGAEKNITIITIPCLLHLKNRRHRRR